MIVYFSGTGNSRFAAQLLAHQIGDDILDAGVLIKSGRQGKLRSERPWVFAAPTYGWQIPRIFAEFLRMSEFSGNQSAYFVLTCGGEIGNAGQGAARLCQEMGLEYRGIWEVVMPENYIAMFDAPDSQEAAQIIAKARPVLRQAAEVIRRGEPFPAYRTGFADKLKSGPVNQIFYRLFVKAGPFYAKGSCVGCGRCVEACPLNNISLVGGKPVWGKSCTHCMACICGCPVEAIEYGKKSVGKPRYQCPAYRE